MRIPERVVADGSRKVMTGKDRTSWRYTARLLPRARSRIVLASRSASPLRTTATPIVSTPIRKKGTGLAKPCRASRRLAVAPLSASRVTLKSAATPGARISPVHSRMVIKVTISARWPASGRPASSGGRNSAAARPASGIRSAVVLRRVAPAAAVSGRLITRRHPPTERAGCVRLLAGGPRAHSSIARRRIGRGAAAADGRDARRALRRGVLDVLRRARGTAAPAARGHGRPGLRTRAPAARSGRALPGRGPPRLRRHTGDDRPRPAADLQAGESDPDAPRRGDPAAAARLGYRESHEHVVRAPRLRRAIADPGRDPAGARSRRDLPAERLGSPAALHLPGLSAGRPERERARGAQAGVSSLPRAQQVT